MRIRRTAIATTRYDFKTLISFLYSKYQKVHPFVEHPSNFGPQKQLLALVFNAKLIQDQIVMEHVSFWFLQSYVNFLFL